MAISFNLFSKKPGDQKLSQKVSNLFTPFIKTVEEGTKRVVTAVKTNPSQFFYPANLPGKIDNKPTSQAINQRATDALAQVNKPPVAKPKNIIDKATNALTTAGLELTVNPALRATQYLTKPKQAAQTAKKGPLDALGVAGDIAGLFPAVGLGAKGISETAQIAGKGARLLELGSTAKSVAQYLPEAKNAVESGTFKYLLDNFSKVKSNYLESISKKFNGLTNVIAADDAKAVIPGYAGHNAADYHEASSAFAKALYDERLATQKNVGNNTVLFLSGGTGTGKTTAIKDAGENLGHFPIVYDTNLTGKGAIDKVQKALDNGFKVAVTFVQRDPVTAFEHGVLPRVKSEGRVVNIGEHVARHEQALSTLESLKQTFGDKISIQYIDNTDGAGGAKLATFDNLPKFSYNGTELHNTLNEKLNQAIQTGQVTREQGESLRISNPNAGGNISRGAQQGDIAATGGAGPIGPNDLLGPFQKERGFAQTVKQAPDTTRELIDRVNSSPETIYNPITNKETLAQASDLINSDLTTASQMVLNKKGPPDALTSVVGQLLIKKAQDAGDFQGAINLVEHLSERLTTSGQGIQAISMFDKLSPEGIGRYAGAIVQRAQEAGSKAKLSPGQLEDFVKKAEELQNLPDGRDKVLKTAQLIRDIHEVVPPNALRKISTIQTMAQLLNPKTWIRNIAGNAMFAGLENVQKLIATGLDVPLSKVTGQRSVTAPNLITQFKGAAKAGREGLQEVKAGVNIKQLPTQFDLNSTRTFKSGPLGMAEKGLNLGLQVPDRMFYQSAFDDSLLSSAKTTAMNMGLKGPEADAKAIDLLGNPTKDMVEQAHLDGLYKTFQDKNVATDLFTGLKKSLNLGKDFGMGDLILKYPKTPAALLMRSIDYSPIGFTKAIKEVIAPLVGGHFNQKNFVEGIARATVGTAGLTTTGAVLQKAGILTSQSEKDTDLRNLQKSTGQGQYKVNTTALKRFVLSGFNKDEAKVQKGDTFVSYDWAQPMAISLAQGAEIGKKQSERGSKNAGVFDKLSQIATTGLDTLATGVDTLAQQPLVQGVQRFFGGNGNLSDNVVATLAQAPSSMIPTLLSQINQAIDNTSRQQYNPDVLKQSLNGVLAKIPVLAATLPPTIDNFGDEAQRYPNDSNNVFNVFVNPAFVNKYLPSDEAKMVLDLYNSTGETKQVPRTVPKKITIDGESRELSPEEINAYQKELGQSTREIFGILLTKKTWARLGDEDKVKLMQSVLTELNSEAKKKIFNISKGKTIAPEPSPQPITFP